MIHSNPSRKRPFEALFEQLTIDSEPISDTLSLLSTATEHFREQTDPGATVALIDSSAVPTPTPASRFRHFSSVRARSGIKSVTGTKPRVSNDGEHLSDSDADSDSDSPFDEDEANTNQTRTRSRIRIRARTVRAARKARILSPPAFLRTSSPSAPPATSTASLRAAIRAMNLSTSIMHPPKRIARMPASACPASLGTSAASFSLSELHIAHHPLLSVSPTRVAAAAAATDSAVVDLPKVFTPGYSFSLSPPRRFNSASSRVASRANSDTAATFKNSTQNSPRQNLLSMSPPRLEENDKWISFEMDGDFGATMFGGFCGGGSSSATNKHHDSDDDGLISFIHGPNDEYYGDGDDDDDYGNNGRNMARNFRRRKMGKMKTNFQSEKEERKSSTRSLAPIAVSFDDEYYADDDNDDGIDEKNAGKASSAVIIVSSNSQNGYCGGPASVGKPYHHHYRRKNCGKIIFGSVGMDNALAKHVGNGGIQKKRTNSTVSIISSSNGSGGIIGSNYNSLTVRMKSGTTMIDGGSRSNEGEDPCIKYEAGGNFHSAPENNIAFRFGRRSNLESEKALLTFRSNFFKPFSISTDSFPNSHNSKLVLYQDPIVHVSTLTQLLRGSSGDNDTNRREETVHFEGVMELDT
ncbi:hypothetical protein HK100_000572 [Physocladia obscura]|uniref:Uncharacterized protein n=1 Tax=Physocladia obscura TaxID=109957 RepID=A0AAD5SY75_9FUNG|nr:hypothetical protein HK100_000572 [Physocladia obscura]